MIHTTNVDNLARGGKALEYSSFSNNHGAVSFLVRLITISGNELREPKLDKLPKVRSLFLTSRSPYLQVTRPTCTNPTPFSSSSTYHTSIKAWESNFDVDICLFRSTLPTSTHAFDKKA